MSHPSWVDRSLTFLHDAARCLALVHQGELNLSPSGGLGKSSLAILSRQTCVNPAPSPPRNEGESPYHSFLFRILGNAGLIGAADRRVLFPATAYEWLDQPAELQLLQLRRTWFQAPEAGWYWLARGSRQRNLDAQSRRITLALVQAVTDLSTTAWTPQPEWVAGLQARGILDSNSVAGNLPRVRRAVERRTRGLIEFTLLDILPCLGLVELQTREDITCLRPTPEAVSWLGAALSRRRQFAHPPDDVAVELSVSSSELRFPARQDPPVTVDDDLNLTVHLAAPVGYTFEIAHFAQRLAPSAPQPHTSRPDLEEAPARYQLTLVSVQRAIAWDYDASDVIFLLERFSGGRLPPAAQVRLSAWEQATTRIACEPGYRLHTAERVVLDALRRREAFRHRTAPFASGQDAWVDRTQASDLFRYLRQRGYVLTFAGDDDATDGPSPTIGALHRAGLPLPQLLVALRTYRHVGRIMPGLADLDLQDLEQDLDAALLPDDRAAVERLLESHAALLAQAPGQQVDEEMEEDGDKGAGQHKDDLSLPAAPDLAVSPSAAQAAIEAGSPVRLTYVDTRGRVTRRRVHPLRLESRWGQRYLVGHCELRQDTRHFRLDRIIELDVED
jgi:hypothetical protein